MAPWRAVVNMAMHRWVPKRHHVLLIVCVEEEQLHVWLQWLENGLCLGNFFSSKRGCQSLWMSTEYRKRMAVRSGEPELRVNSDTGKLSGQRYHPFSLSKPFESEKTPKYFYTRFSPISETALHLYGSHGTVGMTDRHTRKPKYSQKNLSQCHFVHLVHHKPHTNYSRTISGPPRSKAGD